MDIGSYILLRADGNLRAGWRLILFCLVFLLVTAIIGGLTSPFFPATSLAFSAASLGGSTMAATWLMTRFIERRPFREVGLGVARRSWAEAGWGLAGGIFLAGGVTGIEWAAGLLFFQVSGTSSSEAIGSVVSLTAVLIVSAAAEELLFRGYPFQRLIEGVGALSAIGISSLMFGVVHALNPHSTAVGVLNTAVAGILLSLVYLKTRALWLPIGLHFGWNWSLAVFGLPVSGLVVLDMPWQAVPIGPHEWLHGGDYGPEGGLNATLVLLIGIAYLARTVPWADSLRKATPAPVAAEGDPS